MAKRITYVDVDGLTKRERARLKAIKPVVQAAMDQAALDRTLAAGQKLVDAERQRDDELLASARNAFPELRRRAGASQPPPVQPIASANVAGEERQSSVAPPPAAHRAGWYRRSKTLAVKKNPAETYSAPFVDQSKNKLPTGPAPFPAGLNVGD